MKNYIMKCKYAQIEVSNVQVALNLRMSNQTKLINEKQVIDLLYYDYIKYIK